jgi:hypothetical protein
MQILEKKTSFFKALAKNIFEKKNANFLLQPEKHLKVVFSTSNPTTKMFWIMPQVLR